MMFARIVVMSVFFLFYWFGCWLVTGTDKKNLVGLRSYPDAVQKAVHKHPTLGKIVPPENSWL